MLKAEDFKLPLDREFTLVKIKAEIDEVDAKIDKFRGSSTIIYLFKSFTISLKF